MKLTEFLDGMRSATTAEELERAIQADYKHPFRGPTWSRICNVRIEAGERICDIHPDGKFVPRLGKRRALTVCGETYSVGYGQNGAGERYIWHYAKDWAFGVLASHGFSKRACAAIWGCAFDYPHRALEVVADALAGKLPDPPFNRLILGRLAHGPVRVNRKTESKTRAHRPCKCGGWRWDWGCGWNGYANVISWRCDRCRRVYIEYVTEERLYEIRQHGWSPKSREKAA
jgi:hypothetical protein